MINTHDLIVDFGKHRGMRWTRVPVSYLRWLANEGSDKADIAKAELDRRGTVLTSELEVSGHAVDRASLHCRHAWHEHARPGEGLYSWLYRVASEVVRPGEDEAFGYGLKFAFKHGECFPVLLTVIPDKRAKADPRPVKS